MQTFIRRVLNNKLVIQRTKVIFEHETFGDLTAGYGPVVKHTLVNH